MQDLIIASLLTFAMTMSGCVTLNEMDKVTPQAIWSACVSKQGIQNCD